VAKAAEVILRVLDKHLTGRATLRLMGGAALTLAYGLDRATEDADFLMDDSEAEFLAEHCDLGPALERTNTELEPLGLYVSHLWGPEQQILTPEWRSLCRPVSSLTGLRHAVLETLGPLDVIVSKMARADEGDLDDIRYLLAHERLGGEAVRAAIERALVPQVLRDAFAASRPRVEALLP
jgi:hypothetical protein